FRDTSSASKKISPDPSQKLKGIRTLTAEEQLAANMIQALRSSKKIRRSQPHTGGLSEETSVSPRVCDELTVIFTASTEGTGTKPGVPNDVIGIPEAKADSTLD
nr:hypothetical protein [Tanacetum cinerariifolium]